MTQEPTEAKRYYPTPVEQSILIQNVHAYFQKPERSVERNQIAESVASQLQKFSPHWTHRAVRLWFNNNKHAYMTDAAASADQGVPPPQPRRPTVKFGDVMPGPVRMPMPNPPQMMAQLMPQPVAVAPPVSQLAGTWEPADLEKELDRVMERASKCSPQELPHLALHFDGVCEKIKEKGPALSHAYANHKVAFPMRPDVSPFLEHSDSEGLFISRPQSVGLWQDRMATDTKIAAFDATYIDENGAAFVHAGVTPERSISYAFADAQKFGEVWTTQKIPAMRERMDHVVLDKKHMCAWMVSSDHVHRVELNGHEAKAHTQDLKLGPSYYAACPVVLKDSLVMGYSNASDLYFIDRRMHVKSVRTTYIRESGFSCLMPVDDNLLVGMNRSSVIRLLNVNGYEEQSFIGHTDTPIAFARISSRTFVSASDDRSAKIWDLRTNTPITHITMNNQSITALCASTNYVMLSCSDRSVCAIDIRQDPRALLGVSMDEYGTSNMYYNEAEDTLCLFDMATKEGTNDSLLFIDGQGSSSKYIFRKYTRFLRT